MQKNSIFRNKIIRYVAITGIALMNIGALLLLIMSFYHYHEFNKISNYHHTQGVITDVSVLALQDMVEVPLSEDLNFESEDLKFKVDLKYRYMVQEQWYENDVVYAGTYASNLFPNLADAKERAIEYKNKPSVMVYYDAENPGLSVLDPRISLNRKLLVAAFFLIVAGISSALFLLVARVRKS